jgi:hypothetical protein
MDLILLTFMVEVPYAIPMILAGAALQWAIQNYFQARKLGRVVGTLFPPIARIIWADMASTPPHHDFQPYIAMMFAPVMLVICFFVARAIANVNSRSEVE